MIKFKWYDILMILLFLWCIYLILTRIFGHSASDLIINTGLFTFLGVLIYSNINKISELNREVGEIKITMVNSFNKVREDINEIKNIIKKR